MSHQVKQVGAVAIEDLNLLGLAVREVQVKELGCSLRLNMNKREARYWEGQMDKCDGVITFSRALNSDEKLHFYEIALKKESIKKGDQMVPGYGLYADTNGYDQGIKDRISRIFQSYRVTELLVQGAAVGSSESWEVKDRPGWMRVRVTIP